MNLLEQSLWWLVPYVFLMLVMLHAMMEFTVSLLARPPWSQRKPIAPDQLRARLLALDRPDQAYRLVEGRDCDLEIYWETSQTPPPGRFAIATGADRGRLRFLLDGQRHELRMHQSTQSHGLFLGLVGWLPRLAGYYSFQAGPPSPAMTREIGQVAHQGGWGVRPVLWWFQATRRGYRILEVLTPLPLRGWPACRFWGILYPLSYALGMGYLVLIIGPLEPHDLRLLLGISAAWWGVWGFLVWMLLGFPAFWRR